MAHERVQGLDRRTWPSPAHRVARTEDLPRHDRTLRPEESRQMAGEEAMSNPYAAFTEYELLYVPSHLGSAACWDELENLLTDLEFQQTRLGALPGTEPAAVTISDVLRDFGNALDA